MNAAAGTPAPQVTEPARPRSVALVGVGLVTGALLFQGVFASVQPAWPAALLLLAVLFAATTVVGRRTTLGARRASDVLVGVVAAPIGLTVVGLLLAGLFSS